MHPFWGNQGGGSTDVVINIEDEYTVNLTGKIIDNDGSINQSGQTYVYMAFAENPFVANDSGTSIPTTGY